MSHRTFCIFDMTLDIRWFLYKENYPPARTTCFGRAARAGHFFYTVTFTKFTFKVARLAVWPSGRHDIKSGRRVRTQKNTTTASNHHRLKPSPPQTITASNHHRLKPSQPHTITASYHHSLLPIAFICTMSRSG
eukprot:scaffold3225_cov119-Alexandrium_tamarense.AAC.1